VRLFNEALCREVAAEFEWAHDLHRAEGRERLARLRQPALEPARDVLAASPCPDCVTVNRGRLPARNVPRLRES
jgi:hypothetical protein